MNITSTQREKYGRQLADFQRRCRIRTEQLEDIINKLPNKGSKSEDSQKLCLINALHQLEYNINGLEITDFIPDK
jgi:hypothetical protein